MTAAHDPLCPSAEVCYEGRGWLCDLIRDVRVVTLRAALDVVDRGGRAEAAIRVLIGEST